MVIVVTFLVRNHRYRLYVLKFFSVLDRYSSHWMGDKFTIPHKFVSCAATRSPYYKAGYGIFLEQSTWKLCNLKYECGKVFSQKLSPVKRTLLVGFRTTCLSYYHDMCLMCHYHLLFLIMRVNCHLLFIIIYHLRSSLLGVYIHLFSSDWERPPWMSKGIN